MSAPIQQAAHIQMPDGTLVFAKFFRSQTAKGPTVVLNDGLGCAGFAWSRLLPQLAEHHPVLHWHYRGHGHSRIPEDMGSVTIETLAADLEVVLDFFGVPKAVFCAHSMGVQVTLEAYERFKKRFLGLILICGSYKHPISTWHLSKDQNAPKTLANRGMNQLFGRISKALMEYPHVWQRVWEQFVVNEWVFQSSLFLEVNRHRVRREDFYPYFEHLGTMQGRVFAQIARSYASHDAQKILSEIRHPTLVIGSNKDTFCPGWICEDMSRQIQGSELLMISDGTHVAPIEHPDLIALRIEKFMRDRVLQKPKNGAKTKAPKSSSARPDV